MNKTGGAIPEPAPHRAAILTDEPVIEQRVEIALLIMVALSTALAPLNSTMIAVALPTIIKDLNANVTVQDGWSRAI